MSADPEAEWRLVKICPAILTDKKGHPYETAGLFVIEDERLLSLECCARPPGTCFAPLSEGEEQ